MPITIENATAETALIALQQLPRPELLRLEQMIHEVAHPIDESTQWSDEDLRDFSDAGFALYEEIEAEKLKNAQAR